MPSVSLRRLLVADLDDVDLPPLMDLCAGVISLARRLRKKILLPLGATPLEFALIRRGDEVWVSVYTTSSTPAVHQLNRRTALAPLLNACAQSLLDNARFQTDPHLRHSAARMAERAQGALPKLRHNNLTREDMKRSDCSAHETEEPVAKRGGSFEAPSKMIPLAFGYEASIHSGTANIPAHSVRADVHALLFEGELWAFLRGRRIHLAKGPIMLVVQRMVAAIRHAVDAWQDDRPSNVRLRLGSFQIGLRVDRTEEATITLGRGTEYVTATALTLEEAVLPILRTATELLRALVSVDRAQGRNLRVRVLREECRDLRRAIRAKRKRSAASFLNHDPDFIRAPHQSERTKEATNAVTTPRALRFQQRWCLDIDGLDASATFLCGDRLVLSTPARTLALSRNDGRLLWSRESGGGSALMAGSVLLRLTPEGDVDLCDVGDGEPFASCRIAPRAGGPPVAFSCPGGGSTPPVAVLGAGNNQLVAIDLRNGELRWQYEYGGTGTPQFSRSGRVLLWTTGNEMIRAVDLATGEDLWCFSGPGRFPFAPVCSHDTVVATCPSPESSTTVVGVDLYRGALRFECSLDQIPACPPINGGDTVVVGTTDARGGSLHGIDPSTGTRVWTIPDPGLGLGGCGLLVDDLLVINAPGGPVSAIGLSNGNMRWQHTFGDPIADEVPRKLEPVLRGGGLFVPGGSVRVVRPQDGSPLGNVPTSDLVPDLIRVDERSWVYAAEENGAIAAYAPVPHLTLIPGGASRRRHDGRQ